MQQYIGNFKLFYRIHWISYIHLKINLILRIEYYSLHPIQFFKNVFNNNTMHLL